MYKIQDCPDDSRSGSHPLLLVAIVVVVVDRDRPDGIIRERRVSITFIIFLTDAAADTQTRVRRLLDLGARGAVQYRRLRGCRR